MFKKVNNDKGAITLEACVSVLSFLVLMLLLSSLFVFFMAQNTIAHTLLQTSDSLSIDYYAKEHIGTGGAGSVSEVVVSVMNFIGDLFGIAQDDPSFVGKDDLTAVSESELSSIIKTRFVGYLAGGNESEADKLLKKMNVVEGLAGLDFSLSHVEDGIIYINLKYKLEYDFNIWDLGIVEVNQKSCSKLWK